MNFCAWILVWIYLLSAYLSLVPRDSGKLWASEGSAYSVTSKPTRAQTQLYAIMSHTQNCAPRLHPSHSRPFLVLVSRHRRPSVRSFPSEAHDSRPFCPAGARRRARGPSTPRSARSPSASVSAALHCISYPINNTCARGVLHVRCGVLSVYVCRRCGSLGCDSAKPSRFSEAWALQVLEQRD